MPSGGGSSGGEVGALGGEGLGRFAGADAPSQDVLHYHVAPHPPPPPLHPPSASHCHEVVLPLMRSPPPLPRPSPSPPLPVISAPWDGLWTLPWTDWTRGGDSARRPCAKTKIRGHHLFDLDKDSLRTPIRSAQSDILTWIFLLLPLLLQPPPLSPRIKIDFLIYRGSKKGKEKAQFTCLKYEYRLPIISLLSIKRRALTRCLQRWHFVWLKRV